jgi:hypothetical protein
VWKCKKIKANKQRRQLKGGTVAEFLRVRYEFSGKTFNLNAQPPQGGHDIVYLDSGPNYLVPASSAGAVQSHWLGNPNNQGNPAPPPPAMGNLAPTTFRIVGFQNQQGHPMTRGLNGQGGPLPYPSTWSLNGGSPFIQVPQPPANVPTGYCNGLAVVVFCLNGTLPTPLNPNQIYFTRDVDASGRNFNLSLMPAGGMIVRKFRVAVTNGSTTGIVALGSGASGIDMTQYITAGMLAVHPVLPSNTSVTNVTAAGILTFSNAATATGTVTIQFVTYPAAISIGGGLTGNPTIMPLGVYGRISRNPWLPFGPLNLPQSFTDPNVQ